MEQCCALCERKAVMQCDSDQAKLCWECDEKVHSANFLVAKHSRVLLCRQCLSLTPWKGSGPRLTPTVTFCHRCFADRRARLRQAVHDDHHHHRDYVDDDGEYSSDDTYDDDGNNNHGEEDEEEEDEEGENQVVPMSSASASASASSPPSAAALALKRSPDNSFSIDSHGDTGYSSSELVSAAFNSSDESTSMSAFRPMKEHRINQRNY